MMQTLAQRLRTHLQDQDVLGIAQEDAFALILHNTSTQKQIEDRLNLLLNAVNLPVLNAKETTHPHLTAGVSCAPEDSLHAQDLWGHAQHAAQMAHSQQRELVFYQTAEQHNAQIERSALEAGLQHALSQDGLSMHYQPIINAQQHISIVEAFIYWQHPLLGHLKAQHFFTLAEECGLAAAISRKALEKACQEFSWWRSSLPKHAQQIKLNINITEQHFSQLDFIVHLQQTLQQHSLQPEDIILDLTEACIYHHPEKSSSLLLDLRQMGTQVIVDDFGTGFSSLTGLQRFAVDGIKIDQSFVRMVPHKAEESAVVKSLIQLGHNLNLQVIAEGVETEAQQLFLQREGCDGMQGQQLSACGTLESLNVRLSKPKLSVLSA